jgi:hypothetical protein
MRVALWILGLLAVTAAFAAEPPASDSLAGPHTDTLYVIPAGPVAGSFTSAARLTIDDTLAGWARVRVEGWVPVGAVLDRMRLESSTPGPAQLGNPAKAADRPQCAAMTKKGARCTRKAKPGSKYCWQHQNQ